MKEKMLKLLLAVAVAASLLAGCGNTAEPADSGSVANDGADAVDSAVEECEHEWVDATCEEAKHCSKCGETEGEALPHTLMEATYHDAPTCTVCGAVEGEPLQSYFEEHGAEVLDAPVACTVNMVLCDPDNKTEHYMIKDGTWEQIDLYSEPADEEGYQLIHLELCFPWQAYYNAEQDINYVYNQYCILVCDWYTGREFLARDTFANESEGGSDAFAYTTTLDIDGVSYDVSYTKEQYIEAEDWVLQDNGDATNDIRDYTTYTFKVPEGYDGLVLAAIPKNEYEELDTETIDESEAYVFDDDYVEGTVFFRINKEGMVPERLPEEDDSAN